MAVKKDYNALIAELKKNIETVEINLEKARQTERKTTEKIVETTFRAFEKSNKKLIALTQKAPVVSAQKTPVQIARLQKWKASVTEQKQVTSSLKIDLNLAKSVLADIKKSEKERATIEKERAAAIKSTLETRKTKKTPNKSTPKPKTIQNKLATTKTATKPVEKKPAKQKATNVKTTIRTKKVTVTPKATSKPVPERVETPVDQKEEAKETIQTPIQTELIGMNPEFVSIAEPETSLEETLPVKTDSIEKENTEKESTTE